MPQPVPDWRPSAADVAGLTEGAVSLLEATVAEYQLSAGEGLRLLVALRALSRLEALEAGLAREGLVGRDGLPSPFLVAVARERSSFEAAWASLRLGR